MDELRTIMHELIAYCPRDCAKAVADQQDSVSTDYSQIHPTVLASERYVSMSSQIVSTLENLWAIITLIKKYPADAEISKSKFVELNWVNFGHHIYILNERIPKLFEDYNILAKLYGEMPRSSKGYILRERKEFDRLIATRGIHTHNTHQKHDSFLWIRLYELFGEHIDKIELSRRQYSECVKPLLSEMEATANDAVSHIKATFNNLNEIAFHMVYSSNQYAVCKGLKF